MIASASFPALGSTAVVAASDGDGLAAAVEAVRRVVDAFDRACSRFREESELSAVNRAAGGAVRVSPLMIEATLAGVRAAALTTATSTPRSATRSWRSATTEILNWVWLVGMPPPAGRVGGWRPNVRCRLLPWPAGGRSGSTRRPAP